MDEIQIRYQRIYEYNDYELLYKNYIVKTDRTDYIKKEIVSACCKPHVIDLMSHWKIISIKLQ